MMTPLLCCCFQAAVQQQQTISVMKGAELLVVLFKANTGSIPLFRFLINCVWSVEKTFSH